MIAVIVFGANTYLNGGCFFKGECDSLRARQTGEQAPNYESRFQYIGTRHGGVRFDITVSLSLLLSLRARVW